MKIIGLKTYKRKIIKNKKGDIIKYLSKKDNFYKKFGEVYFSEIRRNKVKGWNYHKKNNCLLVVPYGKVQFWFIDGRHNSRSRYKEKKITISKKYHRIISVPAKVWFSFKSLTSLSIVANCMENVHSNKETLKSKKIKNHEIIN